jgi:hypothetical protein
MADNNLMKNVLIPNIKQGDVIYYIDSDGLAECVLITQVGETFALGGVNHRQLIGMAGDEPWCYMGNENHSLQVLKLPANMI